MQWAIRLALGAVGCLAGAAILACGNGAVVIQAILPEAPAAPGPPPAGKGVLAIQNGGERLSVTCVLIRKHNSDTTVANPWGSDRLVADVAAGLQGQLTLDEGLYDIAVVRPSLTAPDGLETDLFPAFLISEGLVHVIQVNDLSFEDVEPDCAAGGAAGMGT